MADSVKISLELADAAAAKALQDLINKSDIATKGFKVLSKEGKNTFQEISVGIGKSIGVFDIFAGNVAANIVVGAFEKIKETAHELFNVFIVEGVKAAEKSESALNALNVALAQTGKYSAETSEEFVQFAEEIQRTTQFSDDAVLKNTALLASLTTLDKDGLKRASKAAIELSAALGKDLETTTEAIAKAANGNTTALNKMGVQFVKTGTDSGTFKNALTSIEEKLSGTAASKVNTFSGAISLAGNAFEDLQKSIGFLIIQNPAVTAAIATISTSLNDVKKAVNDNQTELKLLVGNGLVLFIRTLTVAAAATDVFVTSLNAAYTGAKGFITSYVAFEQAKLAPSIENFKKLGETVKKSVTDTSSAVDKAVNGSDSGNKILDTLTKIGNASETALASIGVKGKDAAKALNDAAGSSTVLTEAQKLFNEENNKFVEGLAKQSNSVKESYDNQLATIVGFYETIAEVRNQDGLVNFQEELTQAEELNNAKLELLQQRLDEEKRLIETSTVDPTVKFAAEKAAEDKFQADSIKTKGEYTKKKNALELQSNKQSQDNLKDSFNTIATLSSSGNKTLAGIGKAAAIANATIDGYAAIQKALASAPPPYNFAIAALVGVATAANVAKISGVQFASGGVVPGTSFTGDQVQARLNSGEMVLNKSQQGQLFEIANGRGDNNLGLVSEIRSLRNDLVAIMTTPIRAEFQGKALVDIFRDELNAGRRI
jgi:hypothetical protein